MAVALGDGHAIFLLEDGAAVCTTGNGARGRLGLGDEEPRHRPVQLEQQAFVSAADQTNNIIMVAAGSDHCAALASDGSLYTWYEIRGCMVFARFSAGRATSICGACVATQTRSLKLFALMIGMMIGKLHTFLPHSGAVVSKVKLGTEVRKRGACLGGSGLTRSVVHPSSWYRAALLTHWR